VTTLTQDAEVVRQREEDKPVEDIGKTHQKARVNGTTKVSSQEPTLQ
jgi:hypothetical protein